jgi:hypothetical protein
VDTERFDRITKQLATGLSRRQAITGIAVALGLATVGARSAPTAARAKRCPSQDGSECPANQVCDNQSLTCTKCDPENFATCKGSTGPGTCCYDPNHDLGCCTCTFTESGTTFGRCRNPGEPCSTQDDPEGAWVCT